MQIRKKWMTELQKVYVYLVVSNGIDVTGKSAKYRVSFVPFFFFTRWRGGVSDTELDSSEVQATLAICSPRGCTYISLCIEGRNRWTNIAIGRHNQKVWGTCRHIRPKVQKRESSCHWTSSPLESY